MSYINRLNKKIKELIYLNKYDFKDIDTYFIVSTGRTATNFLAHYLNENFINTLAVHEPVPDLLVTSIKHLRKEIETKKAINFVQKSRVLFAKNIYKNKQLNKYIESNNNIVPFLPIINNVFPNAKFIHITRDPKTYVVSSLNKMNKSKNSKGYTMYGINDKRPRITTKDFNESWDKEWSEFSQFEKSCWFWKKYNELILENSNKNTLLLKYEDIFNVENTEDSKINDILDYIGLSIKDNLDKLKLNTKLNKSTVNNLDSYENWSDENKLFFHNMTDDIAKKLAY